MTLEAVLILAPITAIFALYCNKYKYYYLIVYIHPHTLTGLLVPHWAPPQMVDRGTFSRKRWYRRNQISGTNQIPARGRNPEVKSTMDCELQTRLPQAGMASQPNPAVGYYREKDPVAHVGSTDFGASQTHETVAEVARLASVAA